MFDRAKFQSVVKDSGLSKREIATVLGVSHATVYGWLENREPGQEHVLRVVNKAVDALRAAIVRGVLPLSRGLPKEERVRKVAIMANAVQGK